LEVFLVDGTYELFRHYYALPSARDQSGCEVAAVRGVLASVLGMIKGGATHIAVATDHVIESFRNGLWPSYKTGEGIDPDLLAQFQLLEDVLSTAGIVVWSMVEFEADDALAAAAMAAARDPRVERVIICTRSHHRYPLAQRTLGQKLHDAAAHVPRRAQHDRRVLSAMPPVFDTFPHFNIQVTQGIRRKEGPSMTAKVLALKGRSM